MSDENQTSPTRQEIEREQTQARAAFIAACKQCLHVFGTTDYRVTVRGAVDFEGTVRAAVTQDEKLMLAKHSFDTDQSEKLTRYISEKFPDCAGMGTGDAVIELLESAYGEDD